MSRPALLRLALASRRSLAIILMLVLATVAVIAGFATFGATARTALLQRALNGAPSTSLGLIINQPVRPQTTTGATHRFYKNVAALTEPIRTFAPPVDGQEQSQVVTTPGVGAITIAWRPGQCEHLTIVAGRCPSAAGEGMVHDATARAEHWHLGTVLHLSTSPTRVKVVGIYQPPAADPFWVARDYFTKDGVRVDVATGSATFDAAFLTERSFNDVPAVERFGTSVVTFGIAASDITPARLRAMREVNAQLAHYSLRSGSDVGAPILAIADRTHHAQSVLHDNSWIFLVQVLIILALLLYAAVDDFIDTRVADMSMLRLRGLHWSTVLRHVLGDVGLLFLLAAPLGILAGFGASDLLSRHAIDDATTPGLSGHIIGTGLLGLAMAYGVLLIAVAKRILTRTGSGSWLANRLAAASRSWVLEIVAGTAITAGLIDLLAQRHAANAPSGHGNYLVLPIVLGVFGGLVIDRVLSRLAQSLIGATRRVRLGIYLAVRHLGRFRRGARTTVIAVAGTAFVTFALSQALTLNDNITRVGNNTVGAAAVLNVSVGNADLSKTVAQIDPSGTLATPVYVTDRGGPTDPATLIVDPRSFAAVAFLAEPDLSDELAKLAPADTAPIIVSGDRLELSLTETHGPAHVGQQVAVALTNTVQGTNRMLVAGPIRVGEPTQLAFPLASCYPNCRLDTIGIQTHGSSPATEAALQNGDVKITLKLRGVAVTGNGQTSSVSAPLDQPDSWFGFASATPSSATAYFTTASNGLLAHLDGDLANSLAFGPATYAVPMPAITVDGEDPSSTPGFAGTALRIHSIAGTDSVPRLRSNAAIISQAQARAAGLGTDIDTTPQVWLRDAAAVPRVRAALTKAGITVGDVQTAAAQTHALHLDGPGLASDFLVAEALLVGLATLFAVLIDLIALSQRRARELIELLQVGSKRRELASFLLTEQSLLFGPGVVAGVVLGVVAERLVSPRLAMFSSPPSAPPPIYPTHLGVASLIALAFVVIGLPAIALVARRSLLNAETGATS